MVVAPAMLLQARIWRGPSSLQSPESPKAIGLQTSGREQDWRRIFGIMYVSIIRRWLQRIARIFGYSFLTHIYQRENAKLLKWVVGHNRKKPFSFHPYSSAS